MIDPPQFQQEGCIFLDNEEGLGLCEKDFNDGYCVVVWDDTQCKYYNEPGGFYETKNRS